MLYAATKGLLLRLFRAPAEPPEPPWSPGGHEAVAIFRASPRFLAYRMVGLLILAAFLALVFLVLVVAAIAEEPGLAFLAAGLLLFALPFLALAYFLIHLDYDLRYYVVTDRSVRVREGAWTVSEKTLTYANVQNLRVTQGPLQRLFGIRDLSIDAAGGGGGQGDGKTLGRGHKVVLAGIENAQEVRDGILVHLKRYRSGAGLGDPEDEGGHGLAGAEVLSELSALRDAARGLAAAAAPVQ